MPPDITTLLDMIRALVGEVNPKWKNLRFTPDTHLERELGLDSMARMELCLRIRASLGIELDDDTAMCAATPNDLMRAIDARSHGQAPDRVNDSAIAERQADASELLMGHFGEQTHAGERGAHPAAHTPGEWLYAVYAWPVFVVIGLLTWLLVVITPLAGWRRKLARLGARLFFLCTFTPLHVTGQEHLDPRRPQVIVANHASYLDGFIVTAALGVPIHFIVKGELSRNLPIRLVLQRFGVEFVDRFNAHKGPSDVRRIAEKSRNGQSLVFFPEGTFTRFPGLQPFRMGAFVTAARSNVPIVPVAIRGARDIVRGDDWFPRRGSIEVTVRPPILPAGEGWQVAIDLRDAARREISRYCGEPDLVNNGNL
ncbi:MAG: 1-acyl-sn-glycerol-3-phosphate acyltransferase [Gammaproteobacteria bacterium]